MQVIGKRPGEAAEFRELSLTPVGKRLIPVLRLSASWVTIPGKHSPGPSASLLYSQMPAGTRAYLRRHCSRDNVQTNVGSSGPVFELLPVVPRCTRHSHRRERNAGVDSTHPLLCRLA